MKKIFFLIKISLFIYFSSFSIVNAKVVYVDLDKILASSIAGSSLLKTFKELDQKNIVKDICLIECWETFENKASLISKVHR